MEKGHNKPPFAIIELDEEITQFILDNCEANQRLGMVLLQQTMETENRAGAEKLVDMIEKFKKLKSLVEAASVN